MASDHKQYVSDVTAIASAITVDWIDPSKPHCFAGLQFFSDAAGETPVVPTAGSVAVAVVTVNSYPNSDSIEDSPIDISGAEFTVSWDANTKSVTFTPTSISGNSVAYWRARVTATRT